MASVRMPDGTVIANVPEGMTQEDLLQQYSAHKATSKPKFQPEEDTQYSMEGIPLVTPTTLEPGSETATKARDVLTDIAATPIRAAMSIAKPVAAISEALGTTALSKPLKQIDIGTKEASAPEEGFLGTRGMFSTLGSLGGDIFGGASALKAGQLGLNALKQAPVIGQQITTAAPKIAQAWDKLGTLGQMSVAGAASAPLEPVGIAAGDEGYGEEKARQAAIGAVAGPVLGKVAQGLGHIASPALKRLEELKAQGIDIDKLIKGESTLGQILGGGAQKIENFLSAFPFSGLTGQIKKGADELSHLGKTRGHEIENTAQTAVNAIDDTIKQQARNIDAQTVARNKSIDIAHQNRVAAENKALADEVAGYSAPVVNRALEPIGLTLPPNVKGTDAVNFAQKAISESYDRELAKIGNIPFLKQEKQQLNSFLEPNNLKQFDLTPAYKEKLADDIAGLIGAAGNKRNLSPELWQGKLKQLGDKAYDARTNAKADYDSKEYAKALTEVKDRWMQLMEDASGSTRIRDINRAHSLLQAPQRASTHLKTMLEGGDFNPEQLVGALKNELPAKRFASGEDPILQDAIKRYQEIAKKKADLKALQEQRKFDLDAAKGKNAATRTEIKDKLAAEKRDVKQDLSREAGLAKEKVNETVNAVNQGSDRGYMLNRLSNILTLAPIAKMATVGAPNIAAASAPYLNPVVGGALSIGPATRLLYTLPNKALKNLATAPRSPMVKAMGETLKNAPGKTGFVGGLSGQSAAPAHPLDSLENVIDEYSGDVPTVNINGVGSTGK